MTAFNVDKTDINLESIDRRLHQLMDLDRATSYAKQKDSLRKEFETFSCFSSWSDHNSHRDSSGYLPVPCF